MSLNHISKFDELPATVVKNVTFYVYNARNIVLRGGVSSIPPGSVVTTNITRVQSSESTIYVCKGAPTVREHPAGSAYSLVTSRVIVKKVTE